MTAKAGVQQLNAMARPYAARLPQGKDWLPQWLARKAEIETEPLPDNIFALLEEAANAVPEEIALHIVATGERLTYRELTERVLRLAAGFLDIGIKPKAHIAVMLTNIVEMPLTWLALARIGAVIVPANVRYTGHELHYLLQDSEATHLVIGAEFLPILSGMPEQRPAEQNNVVVVGESAGSFRRWSDLAEASAVKIEALDRPGLEDLMNIQYTSGTTGLPKGCLLTQRYWLTCAKAHSDCDGMPYRHILAANPYFYMTPQWLLLTAFFQRATLHLASHNSITHYLDWIQKNQIEFCLVPFDLLMQSADNSGVPIAGMKRGSIYIHVPERHAELEQRFNIPLRTAFGMTEIGAGTFTPLAAAEMTGSGSCGIAGPYRECRVMGFDGRVVAAGESGELQVRGPGLFKGYYRKPEATANAFDGEWFRTGDLAVMDERGFVHIVGRLKEMIKRSGENVSAAEVENVLMNLPHVIEAAAVPVPDPRRGEEVKAYLVLEPGRTAADLSPQTVIAQCQERLAVFKIPRYLEYRETPLPRTTSGKIQKPALIAEKPDLRIGSWDRQTGTWIT